MYSRRRHSRGAVEHVMRISERNPYRFDQPTRDPDSFVGRKEILQDCWAVVKLHNFCLSIVGGPGSGKTSLLYQILHRENQEQFLSPDDPSPLIYLDCRAASDAEAVARHISQPLMESLPASLAEEYPRQIVEMEELCLLVEDMQWEGVKTPALLLDNICVMARSPAFSFEFFCCLRDLAKKIPMIITSCQRCEECVPEHIAASNFCNVFRSRKLEPLTRSELEKLLDRSSQCNGISLLPYAAHIETLGGRIPLFTQMACAFYCELLADRQGVLTSGDHQLVFRQVAESAAPHFRRIWAILSPEERALARQAARGQAVDLDSQAAKGLQDKGYLTEGHLFSSVFAEFVRNQI